MSMIIKDKIAKLRKGYPTVSDKYDVEGGINAGTANIAFGDAVVITGAGQFKSAKQADVTLTAANFAGIQLAQNVKTVMQYGAGSGVNAEVLPGEAVSLMSRGFIAVQIAASLTIVAGTQVYYDTTNNVFTNSSSSTVTIPNAKFTGTVEGTLAEIRLGL